MRRLTGTDLQKMLVYGARVLKKNRAVINALNTFPVPDGDTGTNMDLTLRSAQNEVQKKPEDSVSSVALAISMGSLLGARGNSGVILSQLFRGFARSVENRDNLSPGEFADALQEGVNTAYRAVMKPVEGTMLTIARESARAAVAAAVNGADFPAMLQEMVKHAAIVLEKTPDMLPVLKEAGVVDAGGKGLLHIYEGFLLYLQGGALPDEEEAEGAEAVKPQEFFKTEDIVFTYCTELVVHGTCPDPEVIRGRIVDLGDSILVVGHAGVVKIHIHTNNPGQVLEKCLEYGTLHNIKIDNMHEQHSEIIFKEMPLKPQLTDGMAVIAVAAGEGIEKILKSLGAARVVRGGQTMNPSTEDFMQAIKEIKEREVIILPNNKNVILAAEQARNLADREVRVIRTRSVPQGVAALLSLNTELTLDENVKNMEAGASRVKSGQVTYAVSDSRINGKEIKKNDIIGICEEEIVAVGKDVGRVVKDLLLGMVGEDDEIITLYYGEPVDTGSAARLRDELALLFAGKEVELYEGGQPFYYYLISVE